MTKKKLCPHCQTMRPAQGFFNHSETCRTHPGNGWLRDQYVVKGRLFRGMAADNPLGSVSRDTIAKWLDAAGIPRRRCQKGAPRAKKPPVVVALPAPVQGVSKCEGCWVPGRCGALEPWQPRGCWTGSWNLQGCGLVIRSVPLSLFPISPWPTIHVRQCGALNQCISDAASQPRLCRPRCTH